jgi:thioredoxin reductase (NADPH)
MIKTCRIARIFAQKDNPEAVKLRQLLCRLVVHYHFIEVNNEEDAQRYFKRPLSELKLPVVHLPCGTKLVQPTESDVLDHVGFINKPKYSEYDLAIYGAGPAGLSAAVHAGFEGLKVILIEKKTIGGQASTSPLIENYLGFPNGISGKELAERARQQVVNLGVEISFLQEGLKAEFKDGKGYGYLQDGTKISARANLCACGVEYRRLNLPDEDRFFNAGIFYGAGASESPFCKNEHVCIVGGGNGAGQSALNFANYASKVTLIVRGSDLSQTLSTHLVEQVKNHPKIQVLYDTVVSKLSGGKWLKEIEVTHSKTGQKKKIQTKHLFVCIGGIPHTEYFNDTSVIRDSLGYVVTGPDLFQNGTLPSHWPLKRQPFFLEGSVPGLFAAGDVRHNSIKRCASAVGEGAMAIALILRYLSENPAH